MYKVAGMKSRDVRGQVKRERSNFEECVIFRKTREGRERVSPLWATMTSLCKALLSGEEAGLSCVI